MRRLATEVKVSEITDGKPGPPLLVSGRNRSFVTPTLPSAGRRYPLGLGLAWSAGCGHEAGYSGGRLVDRGFGHIASTFCRLSKLKSTWATAKLGVSRKDGLGSRPLLAGRLETDHRPIRRLFALLKLRT